MAEARRLIRLAGVAAAVVAFGGIATQSATAGEVHPNIVGGEPTTVQDNPFMVSLLYNGSLRCGGSIVAPNKILTAAHCTDGLQASDLTIAADRSKLSEPGTTANVTKIWIHPDWNSDALTNDASVLTLDKDLSGAPIALAKTGDTDLYKAGTDSVVTGWGATTEGGQLPDELQQVTVPLTSDAQCTSAYQDRYDAGSMVCAGVPEGGKDSCQGDSGGPLTVAAADGTRKQIGIVSWGDGCARPNVPGVYSRVAAFDEALQGAIGS